MGDDRSSPQITEHPVIWLMRQIGCFLKWTTLTLVALAIVGGGATWAYLYWTNTLPTSQIKIQVKQPSSDEVVLPQGFKLRGKEDTGGGLGELAENKNSCDDPQYPLFIGIINDSRWTLNLVKFRLVAKQTGYTTNLVSDSYYGNSSDLMTAPGKGHVACWAVPELSDKSVDWRSLEWSAEVTRAEFE